MLDDERKYSAATRRKIFEELQSIVAAFNRMIDVCPGCCSITAFDAEPAYRPAGLEVHDYMKMAQDEVSLHTCTSSPLNTSIGLPKVLAWSDHRASLQLFTCFLDGFGVDPNVDKALDCLVLGAERGVSGFQHDLAVVCIALRRPFPAHLPIRKWLMNGVIFGNFDGAAKLLSKTDPQLFQIARHARFLLYDGISFLAGNIEPGLTVEEKQMGYSVLHKAAGSVEQPLDYIRELCTSSTWTKFRSKLEGRTHVSYHVDCTSNDGDTPLLVACRAQRRNVIDLLLTLGVSVTRARYSLQDTPLHWVALMQDCKHIIDVMINRGADIHALSKSCLNSLPWALGGLTNFPKVLRVRGTPLFWAVATGNVESTRFLVDHGANIDLAPPQSLSPLEAAVFMARGDLVKVLLSKVPSGYMIKRDVFYELVANPTLTKQCLEQHSEDNQVEIVKLLSPFCPRNSLEEVYDFFKFSIKNSIQGLGFLLVEAILLCLDECSNACGAVPGRPLDNTSWTQYRLSQVAVQRNDSRILELLLRMGTHLDPETLHVLARYGGNIDCIPILIRYGAKLDTHNVNGPFTPFGFAVLYGNIDVAEALAEHMTKDQLAGALGSNGGLKLSNERRLTLLGAIILLKQVSHEHLKGIAYLFTLPSQLGAVDFTVQPEPIFSALQLVLDDFNLNEGFFQEFSNLPLFRFLLSKYPQPHQINATDTTGYAPLHAAAWLAKIEECWLLVEAGADINLMAEESRTPLDCCFWLPPRGMGIRQDGLGPTREMIRRFEEKRNACASYLRSHGARLGKLEILKNTTMEEFKMPFPERWRETSHSTHHE
jgi:ankyrin repeat protein